MKDYYTIDRILAQHATYNILLGQRANGKSYAVKRECVKEAYLGMGQLIYLRRWRMDLRENDVIDYFFDCPVAEITEGAYNKVDVYRKRIYLANMDQDGKIIRGPEIGRTADLSGAEHLKSIIKRGEYKNVIYEEFCTNEGYLPNEPNRLMQLIATIFGHENTGRVWLIGNTVSRVNPYFFTWQLKSVQKMNPGDLDLYKYIDGDSEITLAVEFCSTMHVENNMFFGENARNITTGVWETRSYPGIPEDFGPFHVAYMVYWEYKDYGFMLKIIENKKNEVILLVAMEDQDSTKKDYVARWVSDRVDGAPLHTSKLINLTRGDIVVNELIKRGKIVYANNLTGSDFQAILK